MLKRPRKSDLRHSPDLVEDIRLARLWLACGTPIADVMTMLEVRHRFELSPDDCRAYAIEILWAAQSESRTEANRKSTPKELPYAAA